ncbi:GGDEF domain-containing phosphodiesterase [Novosphingobium nitrogenifigens]|nr:GGDEF domain-containing phosphodiesterase [Novosphingobium nitrogenifigens]
MTGDQDAAIDSTDLLTGLASAEAARTWLRRTAPAAPVLAMLVSLPRLQAVNLAYGKTHGDQVLIEVARRVADFVDVELGSAALVARLGGGKFLVATVQDTSRERWQYLGEALGRAIARTLTVRGEEFHLLPRTVLLRSSALGEEGGSGEALLHHLEETATTLDRLSGRRMLWADDVLGTPGASLAVLEGELLGAMHRDEISVLFQPQFDVATGRLAGAEALARWEHPRFGQISAETLFAVADRGDHVAQLSRHIIGRAMALATQWPGHLRLSLNITAEDFALGDVVRTVRHLLGETGFAAGRLTLEITEQSLISDFEACARALRALATDGVRVALDDFGTGFSNFRTLKALPLDALKLDKSLVKDIAHDPRDRAIVSAVIAMARALAMKVIAEGVEHQQQLAILREEGCDLFQGFLRSGPMAPLEFLRLTSS